MGTYTRIADQNFFLPRDKFEEAYKAVCELNNRNDLKTGGRHPKLEGYEDNVPRPDYWFAWVDWNYHETCKNLIEVLKEFGFETTQNENGDIIQLDYDSKIGNEFELFKVLAPFIKEASFISWVAEEYGYTWYFENGQLLESEEEFDEYYYSDCYDDGC